jgi:hypothetical protein
MMDGPADATTLDVRMTLDTGAGSVDAGPFCLEWDASAGPYFDLRIDGVPKDAGQLKVNLDNNGNYQIAAGYPSLTLGNVTHSQGVAVLFAPGVGTFPCGPGSFSHVVSFDYEVPSGTITGAESNAGTGPCSMTVTRSGDGGMVQGYAAGKMANITKGFEQTFDFQTCWLLPYPYP